MPRHPSNTNLRIYDNHTYEGLTLMSKKGPFVEEHLFRLKQTIELALEEHPRLLAFRVDLTLPDDGNWPNSACTNELISRFIESFKAKIEYNRIRARDRNKYAHTSKVRYVWCREIGWKGRPHYHLLFLLNRDAFFGPGRLESEAGNLINRLKEAWASALRLSVSRVDGLVNITRDATYRVNRHMNPDNKRNDQLLNLFERASYMCKTATKAYGDRQHSFGASRG